jgi:hypothetical protein
VVCQLPSKVGLAPRVGPSVHSGLTRATPVTDGSTFHITRCCVATLPHYRRQAEALFEPAPATTTFLPDALNTVHVDAREFCQGVNYLQNASKRPVECC